MKCPWPIGERVSILTDDGSTLTYDVYQPLDVHTTAGIENQYHLVSNGKVHFCFSLQRMSLWSYVLEFAIPANPSTFVRSYITHKGKATDV